MNLVSSIQLGRHQAGNITLQIIYDRQLAGARCVADGVLVRDYHDEPDYILGVLRKAAKWARDVRFLERRYGIEATRAYLAGGQELPSLLPGWPTRRTAA